MERIHLAAALVERDGLVLLVASRYPSHPEPLWNLPGGRQEARESLAETAARELHEETGLVGAASEFCYLAESYEGERHFLTAVFRVDARGDAVAAQGDHLAGVAWVRADGLESRLRAAVVREPLLRYLAQGRRYTSFARADISVWW